MPPDSDKPGQLPEDGEPFHPTTEKALAWLVHLHSGTATEQDQVDYETWKAADPQHGKAAERAERLWTMLGPALADGKAGRKGPKGIPIVLLAMIGLGAAAFAGGLFGPPASFFADERAGVGERRSVTLADGSQVDLDTGTSFDVTEGGRRITLYTGQIYVTVARDPTKAFTVRSGEGVVQALGTAFDVRRDNQRTDVIVAESVVRVTYPTSTGGERSVDVSAGREVAFGPETGLGQPRTTDLRERTAWRQGQLRFDRRPLGEVFDELGRYRRGVVVFTDASLRRLPVTGVFDTNDPDALLDAVADLLPVKVRRFPWLTIVQRDAGRPLRPAAR